mmetsp:Transcript_26157/g.66427  ORF Transcript_26157/g.66427 Transcript_26157/m.66427 type:complete len:207 (+) Transcript_26157:2-622(+)
MGASTNASASECVRVGGRARMRQRACWRAASAAAHRRAAATVATRLAAGCPGHRRPVWPQGTVARGGSYPAGERAAQRRPRKVHLPASPGDRRESRQAALRQAALRSARVPAADARVRNRVRGKHRRANPELGQRRSRQAAAAAGRRDAWAALKQRALVASPTQLSRLPARPARLRRPTCDQPATPACGGRLVVEARAPAPDCRSA